MTKLSRATLQSFDKVHKPGYDPAALKPGIVHFGVGNFHRAHQAVYLDDLFATGEGHDWALVGAGVRTSDDAMRDTLKAQDWLTTVVEQEADHAGARITASMVDYVTISTEEGRKALMAYLTSADTRIVAMTITEGGYYIDPASQTFDPAHPDIVADAAHPDHPKTVFGLIVQALKLRKAAGVQPFTVMSCDNIPGNGHVTEDAVTGLAKLSDPTFADWISANVAFPNSMVDRITPATGAREREIATKDFGVDDGWPVFCEVFKQWVMEDNFPTGRPALEKVGVTFTDQVAAYELMKIRILNGGHAAIAYPGGLLDIHFVHEAMEHPLIRRYLEKLTKDEIIPEIPPVPDTDLEAYRVLIDKRFANPSIGDTIRRLCLDGSNRQPKFILPTAADRVAKGHSVTGLALVSAFWCRYCYGTTDSGAVIEPNDPSWDRLTKQAALAKADPAAWLSMDDIFGALAANPAYVAAFSSALKAIWQDGTTRTLERYLAGQPL
ncbi:mannitol dehydrogenase family protein [Brucella haematophila]|uniref:Mannitol dehydrogenase family protein n=1 Tax=Brucella haematophila TaxID=419474 RepID=A0ABX1DPH9_9HYPH|nr:mannitol dehydrogenase family protein [Brucella haematophila]NKC04726.1 mannitol dehydrogenase family protein [Brucella haematophila]TMU91555.1 mannitol dehydrogenase family protein [Brucella haematophila]